MLFGGFSPSGCEARGGSFPPCPLEEVLKKIKGNGMALKEKKKRVGGRGRALKRIPTKPERRLSPSALGKGELEGSGGDWPRGFYCSRAVKTAYTTSALRTGVENCVYSVLHRRRIGGFLATLLVLFKVKIFNGNFKAWEALCVCAQGPSVAPGSKLCLACC